MCYGGYNMEDSILINEGALKRGLFNTTYYNTYESRYGKPKESVDISSTDGFNINFNDIIKFK